MSGVIFREALSSWAGGGLSLIGAERLPCRRLRRNLEQNQNNQAIKVLFLFEKGGAEPSDWLEMIMLLIKTVNAGEYDDKNVTLCVIASQAASFRLRRRRGYDRMGVIYFPFRSYLMKKVRTGGELLHKVLSSRAI